MTAVFDFESFPRLETSRLILRETSPGDAPALFEYYRDPEMTRYVSFPVHRTVGDTLDFLAWISNIYRNKDSIRWGIELKTARVLIGTAGLHFWRRAIRCAEVGYHIAPAYWGNGYATEVLRAMVAFGFERMNLNRIEGMHNAGNDASGRVMEKVGFRREGVWRQRVYKDGQLVDAVWFSLLREEYSLAE